MKKDIIQLDFKKIITFDIKSDRILSDNSMKHEISDNLVTNNELKLIDSGCIDFCQWYNENNGNELLSHENINLGSLFRIEFHNFLIPFLKNFLIINKILRKFPGATFFCSPNIYQIFNKLTQNAKPIENYGWTNSIEPHYNYTINVYRNEYHKKVLNYILVINISK